MNEKLSFGQAYVLSLGACDDDEIHDAHKRQRVGVVVVRYLQGLRSGSDPT